MRILGLVVKHEIVSTANKRSFWLTTFLFPVMLIVITLGPQLLARRSSEPQAHDTVVIPADTDKAQTFGYVDAAGIVMAMPPGIPVTALRAYADEAAARAAVLAGAIRGYYLIPADYMRTGEVALITPEIAVLRADQQSGQFDYILRYNLTGDATLASLLIDPTPSVVLQSLAPAASVAPAIGATDSGPTSQTTGSGSLLPAIVMFVLFFIITMSAGYMLQSVVKEKENRMAEVLLVSLRPRELMLGKVIGLGCLALFQMAMWFGGGMLAMGHGQPVLALLQGNTLSPSFIIWAFLFFLGGYVVYATALGALGALAPNMREGSQFTFILLLPLLVPVWLNTAFTEAPHGVLATALSLFPLTASTAMVSRLSAGGVPFWQAALALFGLLVTAYAFVVLAARFFRADILLSSRSLNWGRLIREVRGRKVV